MTTDKSLDIHKHSRMHDKDKSIKETFSQPYRGVDVQHMPVAKELFMEFLNQSTIHGCKLFLEFRSNYLARRFWFLLMMLLMLYAHWSVYQLAVEFTESPTETRISPNLVHVKNVPFPAIAMCSGNRISKRKLFRYAEEVYAFQEANHPNLTTATTVTEMANHLLLFGGFFVHPFNEYTAGNTHIERLHELMISMYNNTSEYPTREILRDLATDCDELLIRCSVRGSEVNCSKIFFQRTTSVGVCCIFNYRRVSYATDAKILERDNLAASTSGRVLFTAGGQHNALEVVLKDDPDDFAFKEMSSDSFRILVFNRDDYPDIESGGCMNILAGYNQEIELLIEPEVQVGSTKIRQFPATIRDCYFPDEGVKVLKQTYYSLSECILNCRMESVLSHCGCMIPVLPNFKTNSSYCMLMDLPCLSMWKRKWWQWDVFDYVPDSNKEQHSILNHCHLCLPNCNSLRYGIMENYQPLDDPTNGKYYTSGILKNLKKTKSMTVVKVFFKSTYLQAKQHDVTGDWVVLLNRFGGICSIMYGFSFISALEIFYHFCGKWWQLWLKGISLRVSKWFKRKSENLVKPTCELYWDELNISK